jgi:hypothetical protein
MNYFLSILIVIIILMLIFGTIYFCCQKLKITTVKNRLGDCVIYINDKPVKEEIETFENNNIMDSNQENKILPVEETYIYENKDISLENLDPSKNDNFKEGYNHPYYDKFVDTTDINQVFLNEGQLII